MVKILDENRIRWDYDVPEKGEYEYTFGNDRISSMKKQVDLEGTLYRDWLADFVVAGVPADILVLLSKENFSIEVTEQNIEEFSDNLIANKLNSSYDRFKYIIKNQYDNIEADGKKEVDESIALNSLLRSLHSKKLELEDEGKTDTKEYFNIIETLRKTIELKLKAEKKIDSGITLSMEDLIKVDRNDIKDTSGSREDSSTSGGIEEED